MKSETARTYELAEKLQGTWGERVLVMYVEGEPREYYADSPENKHAVREAWPDYYDEPVWMHVNEVGYRLSRSQSIDAVSWEFMDWDDAPVSTDWEVEYPA